MKKSAAIFVGLISTALLSGASHAEVIQEKSAITQVDSNRILVQAYQRQLNMIREEQLREKDQVLDMIKEQNEISATLEFTPSISL